MKRVLRARDVMTAGPITVDGGMTISHLCDLLQEKNVNGAPVVDAHGRLVGVVTQEDIIYGTMGQPADQAPAEGTSPAETGRPQPRRVIAMLRDRGLSEVPPAPPRQGEKPFWSSVQRTPEGMELHVGDIMTSPAISADEETPIDDLCRIMWNLRIHRVPILKKGKVTGLVSSMDLCRAVIEGTIVV